MSVIEGIPVFFLQICLSLMVWYAVNRKGKTWMFPLAILTHALINIPAGLMQSGLTHSLAIVYIPLFLTVLLAAVFLILAYQFGAYFQERKTKKEAYQNLLLYAHELEGLNDDLSAFKHDYINILMTLDESFRDKDFDQAEHIFYDTVYPTKELIQGQRSNIQKYAKIRIQELRNLLISKEIHAKEKGVLFHVEIIGIIEETQVSMIDLIRAISILIDNAVEATMQVDDCDTIEISLVHVDGDFSFACKNSILGLEFDRNRLFEKNYSTKNELLPNHGIGLYSLNKILDKNPFMALKTKVIGSDIIQTLYIKGETPNQLKEVLS